MAIPKTTIKNGIKMHHSVGAIIKKGKKILIIKRGLPPPGYACIAGHIDKNEKSLHALKREVKEESNLDVISQKFLFRKLIMQKKKCVKGIKPHFWYFYECNVSGKLNTDKVEVKSIKFMSRNEIKKLYKQKKLDYPWEIAFKKLKVI